jgi:methylmalonyl-CoA/ethylmalonyl-CoA epimerase
MSYEILGVEHLGIVPKDPEQCRFFFQSILGLPLSSEEIIEEQKVSLKKVAFSPVLEILEPLSGDSPVASYLNKKGGGIHHMALEVKGLEEILLHLKGKGVILIDSEPKIGSHGTRIAFIHPKSTGGILVELVEKPHHA